MNFYLRFNKQLLASEKKINFYRKIDTIRREVLKLEQWSGLLGKGFEIFLIFLARFFIKEKMNVD